METIISTDTLADIREILAKELAEVTIDPKQSYYLNFEQHTPKQYQKKLFRLRAAIDSAIDNAVETPIDPFGEIVYTSGNNTNTEVMNPPETTIFRWSCFAKKHPFVNTTKDCKGSEYQSAKEAAMKIVDEDGEIAWDTGGGSHPGDPMRKKIFGLYGKFDDGWDLTADIFDKDRKDLVGCATLKDWEWFDYAGYDDDEETFEDTFTDENILKVLEEELSEFMATQ